MTGPTPPAEPAATPDEPIDPADPGVHDATEGSRRRGFTWRTALEWVTVLGVALAVALLVRAYVIQTYFIPSVSMEPTLAVGDHILVLKAAYRFTSPATGDVIVFKAPPKEHRACLDPRVEDLVKRIIGLPGQTISSGQGRTVNTIYINGDALKQPWQHTFLLGTPIRDQVIPANRYFVMGDNRPESCDSRVWGTVPRGDIVGKAIAIFWPPARVSTI